MSLSVAMMDKIATQVLVVDDNAADRNLVRLSLLAAPRAYNLECAARLSEGGPGAPVWAPDGKHLVFMSTRTGRPQIWSMTADGSNLHQLTTEGSNSAPVWGR